MSNQRVFKSNRCLTRRFPFKERTQVLSLNMESGRPMASNSLHIRSPPFTVLLDISIVFQKSCYLRITRKVSVSDILLLHHSDQSARTRKINCVSICGCRTEVLLGITDLACIYPILSIENQNRILPHIDKLYIPSGAYCPIPPYCFIQFHVLEIFDNGS